MLANKDMGIGFCVKVSIKQGNNKNKISEHPVFVRLCFYGLFIFSPA